MKSEPQAEHQWLRQLVGEWSFEAEGVMEPGKPPRKLSGSESVRTLGDLWVVAEGRGAMPDGTPMTSLLTLGYDPIRQRYVGTWVGSMMTHLWIYEGTLDSTRKVLTLVAEGPSFTGEGMAQFHDVIEIDTADHRILRSRSLGDDGTAQEFMTAHYRRTA